MWAGTCTPGSSAAYKQLRSALVPRTCARQHVSGIAAASRSAGVFRSAPSTSGRHAVRAQAAAPPSYPPPSPPPQQNQQGGTHAQEDVMSAEEVKAALLDSFWGTQRGLSAKADVRADINELITQLEAMSPVTNPTEAMEKLNGTWRLVYTSNSELLGLLALDRLPFVTVHDIKQAVDGRAATVVNALDISLPGSRTSLSTTAAVTVESPKRVSLKFEKSTISTPQLMTELDLPDYASVLGQSVDLRGLKGALQPLSDASRGARQQIADFVSRQPDLDLPVPSRAAETWLLTTYLDDSLRISRGDQGSIFVLTKESGDALGSAGLVAATGAMPSREPNRVDAGSVAQELQGRVQSALAGVRSEGDRVARNLRESAADPAAAIKGASAQINDGVQSQVNMAQEIASDPADSVREAVRDVSAVVRGVADDAAADIDGVSSRDAANSKQATMNAQDAALDAVDGAEAAAAEAQRALEDPAAGAKRAINAADSFVQGAATDAATGTRSVSAADAADVKTGSARARSAAMGAVDDAQAAAAEAQGFAEDPATGVKRAANAADGAVQGAASGAVGEPRRLSTDSAETKRLSARARSAAIGAVDDAQTAAAEAQGFGGVDAASGKRAADPALSQRASARAREAAIDAFDDTETAAAEAQGFAQDPAAGVKRAADVADSGVQSAADEIKRASERMDGAVADTADDVKRAAQRRRGKRSN